MKPYILIRLILIASLMQSSVNAQYEDAALAFNGNKNSAIRPDSNEYSTVGTDRLNDISIRAVRNFSRVFKGETGVKWYKVEDGFIARFSDNGVETKVTYGLTGDWNCTMRTYGEAQMTWDVRDIVKRKYYDYHIMVVYEIQHSDNVAYIVKIEDAKTLKTILVSNGEAEVLAEYVKG